MCTVTFVARRHGFLLGMNRDEKRTRVRGLPPESFVQEGVRVLRPAEPQGGSWIAVNEAGVCFALINWYAIDRRAAGPVASRGDVVVRASPSSLLAQAGRTLRELPLSSTNPFRLIGVSARERRIVEWRWNLEVLAQSTYLWRSRQWSSSGYDEPGAQRTRGCVFSRMLALSSCGSLDWLRRLHRSHAPRRGAYSTCMHREDAATVSYTEVDVSREQVVMRFSDGPLCGIPRSKGLPETGL